MAKSTRLANFELLRIIAMAMIILLHCNSWMIGSVDQGSITNNPLGSFWRVFSQQICIVGANVFVMISGWFGIKPSIKGGGNFLYQIIYHSITVLLLAWIIGLDVSRFQAFQSLSLGSWNWFVPCYLGLYLLSPALNVFVNNSSVKTLGQVLIVFLIFEALYGWLLFPTYFSRGYSIISFIGLYLLARYLRLQEEKIKSYSGCLFFAAYLILTILPALGAFFGIKYFGKNLSMTDYSSPFVIAASTAFFLAFCNLKIVRGVKIINWGAASMFAVIMIHVHPVIAPYFKSFMKGIYASGSDLKYTCVAIAMAFLILLVCIIADQPRKFSWNIIWDKCIRPIFLKFKFEV